METHQMLWRFHDKKWMDMIVYSISCRVLATPKTIYLFKTKNNPRNIWYVTAKVWNNKAQTHYKQGYKPIYPFIIYDAIYRGYMSIYN